MVFKKIYKCLFIPNCTRKIMWLHVINKIHEKYKIAHRNYAEAKCTSSAKITLFFKSGYYSNPASDIVPSVKTTMYNQNNNIQCYFHIFKVQKSSKSS